jgi:hypothetical protein
LSGNGKYVRPVISYNAVGGRYNGGIATITLTCIDRSTGETIGEWSANLPSFDSTTKTLQGNFFEAKSGREYLYWVKVYARASINLNGDIMVDYRGTDAIPRYVKVNYLSVRDSSTLNIQTSSGGTTIPAPGTYTYNYGSSVTVTAIPDSYYGFNYWLLDGTQLYDNPITVTMDSDHTLKACFPSGGGPIPCPTLFVWSSTVWIDYGVIDIHNPSGEDVVREVFIAKQDLAVEYSKTKLRLQEGWEGLNFSESDIDQVKLYAVDDDGNRYLCPLIKAVHDEQGNVLPKLLISDDYKVKITLLETIDLTFVVPYQNIQGFTFIIEGNNMLKP